MQFNRKVVMGFRNIGDANDKGEIFEGALIEAFEWLIQQMNNVTIAKRITINIARNREEASFGLTAKQARSDNARDRLANLLGSINFDSDEDEPSQLDEKDPEDTWVGFNKH